MQSGSGMRSLAGREEPVRERVKILLGRRGVALLLEIEEQLRGRHVPISYHTMSGEVHRRGLLAEVGGVAFLWSKYGHLV